MTQVIPEHYDYAQRFIACGLWRVDPDLGLVYGIKDQPFQRENSWGYIQIKFRHPADYRAECAVLAHRVIWESVHGPIDLALQINHVNGRKTDNRIANLEAVTGSANMQHAYGAGLNQPNRSNARLTEGQVLDVYRRCWAGERDDALADEYGVKRSAINNIRNGWTWRHITGHQPAAR